MFSCLQMTLEDLRAKQSAPPMRTLPNPPGISLCGPKTTSLNQVGDLPHSGVFMLLNTLINSLMTWHPHIRPRTKILI